MSATLEESALVDYFSCPIVYVKGRTYPVEEMFLDDVCRFVLKKQPSSNTTELSSLQGKSRKERRAITDGLHKLVSELRLRYLSVTSPPIHKHPQYFDLVAELISSIIRNKSPANNETFSNGCGDAILVFLSGELISVSLYAAH